MDTNERERSERERFETREQANEPTLRMDTNEREERERDSKQGSR
jgi:hypothetical protein